MIQCQLEAAKRHNLRASPSITHDSSIPFLCGPAFHSGRSIETALPKPEQAKLQAVMQAVASLLFSEMTGESLEIIIYRL